MSSLSYKIGLGYLIIISLNISLAIYAIFHINNLNEPLDKLLQENYSNISSAENMKLAFTQQELTQLAMLENSSDSLNLQTFKQYGRNFSDWQQQAYASISLPVELIILDSLRDEYSVYLSKSDTLQEMVTNNILYVDCKAYHYNHVIPLASRISKLCSRLKQVNERAIFEAGNKAKAVSYEARIYITLFAFFVTGISLLAGIYFTRKIIKPLKETTNSVRKIRKGQINQKVAITTNDEIAELGIEFNSMTDRMNRYVRDVSGLKELDQLKSDFMTTISHEFKTPLTSINMTIDILQKEIKGPLTKGQKELLSSAKDDVRRLNSFSKDLLDLSKLESGAKKFDFQKIKITSLLESVLQSYKQVVNKKNIGITIRTDPTVDTIIADKKELSRVLSNLLDNAIRYSEISGKIYIYTKKRQEDILFCIQDFGPGIADESLDLIFEKFVQVENKNNLNTGLGLAIAKEIIEQHRGKIWAVSQPDAGTSFFFTLPLENQK